MTTKIIQQSTDKENPGLCEIMGCAKQATFIVEVRTRNWELVRRHMLGWTTEAKRFCSSCFCAFEEGVRHADYEAEYWRDRDW